MTFIDERAVITYFEEITPDIYSLHFQSPQIASTVKPGQFLMIRVDNLLYPLWRRAFSVARVSADGSEVEILVLKAGRGTQILSHKRVGDTINILGPLGNHFNIQLARERKALLVAGGIGIAPMFILHDHLLSVTDDIQIIFGARSARQLIPMRELTSKTLFVTEDGSEGEKGLVTDGLKRLILESTKPSVIYACGPNAMLQQVSKIALEFNIPCQVSLETLMACGLGVCMGCPVPNRKHPGKYVYACVDGPVFDHNDIVFEGIF